MFSEVVEMKAIDIVHFAIITVVVAIVAVFGYGFLKDESALFSTVDRSIDTSPDSSVYRATIKNEGDVPVTVHGYGVDLSGCVPVEDLDQIVLPGASFEVNILLNEEAGCTEEAILRSNFYIMNTPSGDNTPQISIEGGSNFPRRGGDTNNLASSGSSGGSGGSSAGETPSSGSFSGGLPGGQGTNPGGTQTGQGSATLSPSEFVNIAGDPSFNSFSISDNTPAIVITPPTSSQPEQSVYCRWHTADKSFAEMPAGQSCSVDAINELGLCTLPLQAEGAHSYYVSCSAGTQFNGPSNNLDISGVVDSIGPIYTYSPSSGTSFPYSSDMQIVNVNTNEPANCKAASSSSTLYVSYDTLPIYCSETINSHSCAVPLNVGNNHVYIICKDYVAVTPNTGSVVQLTYTRSAQYSIGTQVPSTSVGSSGSSGGTNIPDNVDQQLPAGDVDITGSGTEDIIVGETIREFNSEKTLFSSIVDWFREVFD